jgi:hypothetical protein
MRGARLAKMSPQGDFPHMNAYSYSRTRALSRQLFPNWSRRARARWVLARMRANNARVPISAGWSHDSRAYWFQRTARA